MIEQAWYLFKRHWFALLVAAAMVETAVELVVRRNSDGAPTTSLWITVPLLAVMIVPLFWWRRFPFGAPAAVFVIGAVESFVDGRLVTFTLRRSSASWPPCSCSASSRTAGSPWPASRSLWERPASSQSTIRPRWWSDFAGVVLLFSIAWLAGFAIGRKLEQASAAQERADRLEREQEAEARAAVAEERARIARELHDVVGHSVSVMTVQASAVRRRLNPDQEQEREALEIVEQTGREALAEMRRLVGVLRRPEEGPALAPQPSLQHLDRLVAQARESGLPVELRIEGEPTQLPPGVDLTAYRLVQEGLTNAIKHARRVEGRRRRSLRRRRAWR